MYRIKISIIVFLIFGSVTTHARVSKEYFEMAEGKFEMPKEIQDSNSVSDLRPFLLDKRDFNRMAAVRRLGEIGGEDIIDLVLDLYENEPSTKGNDQAPLVKLEIIRTLGRMDSLSARDALINLTEKLWKKGPYVPDGRGKGYYYVDRDFGPVMPLLLEELNKWSDNEKVHEIAKHIAFNEEPKEESKEEPKKEPKKESKRPYAGSRIEENAWVLYLKGDMSRQGLKGEKESLKYWLNLLKDLEDEAGIRSEYNVVKWRASKKIIEQYSEEVLSSVQNEIEEELENIPRRDPNGTLSQRYLRLNHRRGYIENALKAKVEKRVNKSEKNYKDIKRT